VSFGRAAGREKTPPLRRRRHRRRSPPTRPTTTPQNNSCSPCKRIEPSYRALRRSFDGSGVRFARAEVGGDNDPNAAATDSLASELDVSTLPTWVCLRGGGGEVARVEGVRHKRPLQPVAAAVRRRLLLQPLGAAEGDDDA
jgi:hypothetical protein